ncbi:MAG: hypothetical protein R3B84_21740 [Zavarzinella sp.]
MKRTAAAFMLLAGLGGCMTTKQKDQPVGEQLSFGRVTRPAQVAGVTGPYGEPFTVKQANLVVRGKDANLRNAAYQGDGANNIMLAGGAGGYGSPGLKARGGYAPVGPEGPGFYPGRGILPVPGAAPFGAVAAIGAMPPGGMMAPINARTSIRFGDPLDMKVGWMNPDGTVKEALVTPARYNFLQGGIYRLKLSNIQGRPGLELYPTLEVNPASEKSAVFLDHNSVPLSFTDDDFEQVAAGHFLVKVVYLPHPQFQDLADVGTPEVISVRLEPGTDPIAEARRRGDILLIVRMGNIDLEAPNTPPLTAPSPFAPPAGFPMPGGPGGQGGFPPAGPMGPPPGGPVPPQ